MGQVLFTAGGGGEAENRGLATDADEFFVQIRPKANEFRFFGRAEGGDGGRGGFAVEGGAEKGFEAAGVFRDAAESFHAGDVSGNGVNGAAPEAVAGP